ncbi:MAG: transcription termination/antitermination protein NusG [Nitrospira sp.]|nr:transcription termination/antitermination protein NusG [Nitrospira sp.]MDD9860674.1 transcription termination/antitermination protein NusG [Nitrospira sp.]
MAKNWYVIHTYAGYEGRVQASLTSRASQMGLEKEFGQVLVPTEDVIEIKDGKRRTSKRKFFPGYVLVELEDPLKDATVIMIKETPKVTGFIGGGTKPMPLPQEEADFFLKQIESGVTAPRARVIFSKGNNVRIVDGPFMGFNGLIDVVDDEHGRAKVLVSILGRATPVELAFTQIEHA